MLTSSIDFRSSLESIQSSKQYIVWAIFALFQYNERLQSCQFTHVVNRNIQG